MSNENIYICKVELSCGIQLMLPPCTGINELVNEIIIDDCYKVKEINSTSPVVIDVGAHVGVFSLFVSEIYPSAKIFSFESHPLNYRLLNENIKLNHRKNISSFHIALEGYSGQCKVYSAIPSECHTTFLPKEEFYRERLTSIGEVQALCLDDCVDSIGSENIDLLKMDCEGAEGEILKNTSVSTLSKISRIALEYHEDVSTLKVAELANLLQYNGFKTEQISSEYFKNRGMLYAWKGKNW